MQYIHHRINTIEQLKNVGQTAGIELDVRYHQNDLILHHDPFAHHQNSPLKLAELLAHYQHNGPLILNVKTEGVELKCIEMMQEFAITNWFFLDLSMPYFCIYAQKAIQASISGFCPENLCVRYSEYEPIEYALSFSKKAKWVWVDCFTHLPLTQASYTQLKEAGFQICLVSPELQQHPESWIPGFKKQLASIGAIDAVCTKHPQIWQKEV